MNRYIVVCRCSGMDVQAKMAFEIAFPKKEMPEVFRGKNRISFLADSHPNTNLSRYLQAINKKNGRFAYYIEEDGGDVTLNYDLLKGKRVG